MKKLFLFLAASILLFSCQKEFTLDTPGSSQGGGSNTVDFTGNYKFVNFTATTLSINETFDGMVTLKAVTRSNYTSANNTGTVVFTKSSMNYTNLSYSINTIAKSLIYEDGVLTDSISMPLQMNIPAMAGQSAFTLIGKDSLSFPGGGAGIGGVQTTGPAGAKIKVEQGKLYLTQRVKDSTSSTIQGVKVKEFKQAEVITTFQRM